ncbi:MAG: hypothetical protein ACYDBY_04210 [Thermoanaerobaculia bacterium]
MAVLDMNHGFPNLGHASVVERLERIGAEERERLGRAAPEVRVVSYDVRRGLVVPANAARFPLVVGTGGPGALDPRENDGVSPLAQGIVEDPAWEAPLWRFFDDLLARSGCALFGICHTFGLLARWAGFGEAVARGPEKGKSAGAVPNRLTAEAEAHPWFGGYYRAGPDGRVRVLDSRLFDILPTGRGPRTILAHEADAAGNRGEALTMVELDRFADGSPRVWAVNHHPEIGGAAEQRESLMRLASERTVGPGWLEERLRALDAFEVSPETERGLRATRSFTFEEPVRAVLARALAERSEAV